VGEEVVIEHMEATALVQGCGIMEQQVRWGKDEAVRRGMVWFGGSVAREG
jgi:hypothetical protein